MHHSEVIAMADSMSISTKDNPLCSCGHRQSQHTVSGSQSCIASVAAGRSGTNSRCCPCSCFDLDLQTPGKFQPANHIGHDDTCRNCGKSRIFHLRDECLKVDQNKDKAEKILNGWASEEGDFVEYAHAVATAYLKLLAEVRRA